MTIDKVIDMMNKCNYLDVETLDYVSKPKFFDNPDVIIDTLSDDDYKEYQRCEQVIEIDAGISDVIQILNKKGYETYACCSGHIFPRRLLCGCPVICHIEFLGKNMLDGVSLPDGFVNKKSYQTCTLECEVVPKNKYKKNRKTKTCELTDEYFDYECRNLGKTWDILLDWAKNLPYKK